MLLNHICVAQKLEISGLLIWAQYNLFCRDGIAVQHLNLTIWKVKKTIANPNLTNNKKVEKFNFSYFFVPSS